MATINDFLISDFIVSDVQPLYSNQANSGRLITRSTGIQYFRIEFTITLKTSDRLLLQQFLAQQSQGKSFPMSLGYYSVYTGAQTVQPVVLNPANASTYKVQATTKFEVGTLIQFSGHKKIYRVLDNSNGYLSIFPALRQPVQKSEQILYKDLQGTFLLNLDKNTYEYKSEEIITMKLIAIEDITA